MEEAYLLDGIIYNGIKLSFLEQTGVLWETNEFFGKKETQVAWSWQKEDNLSLERAHRK